MRGFPGSDKSFGLVAAAMPEHAISSCQGGRRIPGSNLRLRSSLTDIWRFVLQTT
jgi:hypothetical protein